MSRLQLELNRLATLVLNQPGRDYCPFTHEPETDVEKQFEEVAREITRRKG